MKCVRVDLPETLDSINIEIFSDLHIGSKKCDYDLINKRIKKVAESNNTYAVILGDICNNSTKNSVGDVYEEELSPMQEVNRAVRILEPIKDKIIGITSGNHERRTYKSEGIDLGWFIAKELRIADKYDYASCLLFVRFGHDDKKSKSGSNSRKMCYTIMIAHGDGQGGRTVGGKANGLQRRGQIVDADIIITGHTHQPLSFRDCAFKIDYPNSCVNKFEQVFVNASSSLDYEQYAELYGMKPSSKLSPVIVLDGHSKNVIVNI